MSRACVAMSAMYKFVMIVLSLCFRACARGIISYLKSSSLVVGLMTVSPTASCMELAKRPV